MMDQRITIKEVAEFLKNPPSVSPRLDFAKVRALCKHIIKALKQLECPQSQVHGWSGLIMDPALYILLKPKAFVIRFTGPNHHLPSICDTGTNENDRLHFLQGTRTTTCPS
jgi:hypothetical protein